MIVQVWRLVYAKALVLQEIIFLSIEALCCGYMEPKKLRIWLQNKASTPIWMKIDHFYLKGVLTLFDGLALCPLKS